LLIFKAGWTHYLLNLLTNKIISTTKLYNKICFWPEKKLIFFINNKNKENENNKINKNTTNLILKSTEISKNIES